MVKWKQFVLAGAILTGNFFTDSLTGLQKGVSKSAFVVVSCPSRSVTKTDERQSLC